MAIFAGDATDGVRSGLAGRLATQFANSFASRFVKGAPNTRDLNLLAQGIVDALDNDKIGTAQYDGGIGSSAGIPFSTVTTKGDLIAAVGNAAVSRLGIGADGTLLTADSAQATGMRWSAASWIPLSTVAAKGDIIGGTGSG